MPKRFYIGEMVTTKSDPRLFFVGDRHWQRDYSLIPCDSVSDLSSSKEGVKIAEILYPVSSIAWGKPVDKQGFNVHGQVISSKDGRFRIFTSIGGRARGMFGVEGLKATVSLTDDGMRVNTEDTTKTGIPIAVADAKRLANEFVSLKIPRERANAYMSEKSMWRKTLLKISYYKDELQFPISYPSASREIDVWKRSYKMYAERFGRVIRQPIATELALVKEEKIL